MLQPRLDTMPPLIERSHPVSEAPIRMVDGSYVSATELAGRFYDSEYGVAMRNQPLRFSTRYGYDRDQMLEDNGHDLCPIGHQMEAVVHLGKILDHEKELDTFYGNLSDEEIGITAFALMIHDIGEDIHERLSKAGLTIVGDIPAGLKTDANRVDEARIREFHYAETFFDVDSSVIAQVEAIVSHRDTTHLHDLFEAAHHLQTLETTTYAHHRLKQTAWAVDREPMMPLDDGARLSGLLGMSRVVMQSVQQKLEPYSFFAEVQHALDSSKNLQTPLHKLLN